MDLFATKKFMLFLSNRGLTSVAAIFVTFTSADLYFDELDGKTANFSLTMKPKNGFKIEISVCKPEMEEKPDGRWMEKPKEA